MYFKNDDVVKGIKFIKPSIYMSIEFVFQHQSSIYQKTSFGREKVHNAIYNMWSTTYIIGELV